MPFDLKMKSLNAQAESYTVKPAHYSFETKTRFLHPRTHYLLGPEASKVHSMLYLAVSSFLAPGNIWLAILAIRTVPYSPKTKFVEIARFVEISQPRQIVSSALYTWVMDADLTFVFQIYCVGW